MKFLKKHNILLHSSLNDSFPNIEPAKNFIPQWYKDADALKVSYRNIKSLPVQHGFKSCSAFSDAFFSGYIIPLSMDIAVEQTENGPKITWNGDKQIVVVRNNQENPTLPVPIGCSNVHFAWHLQHIFNIPEGYSAIVTHPLNRYDLPFITLGGVIDGEFCVYDGDVPVFFSNTFEGLIPAGTPILQILLFKTENWNSKVDKNLIKTANINLEKSANAAFGWYKRNIWKQKKYE
jgi:hypothetical protein